MANSDEQDEAEGTQKETSGKKKATSKKKRRRKKKATTRKKAAKKTASTATTSRATWTFPKNPLEEALGVARAIEDKNAGKPMRAVDLVKAVGFNQANDWRFLDLLRSANLYGLVSGTGASATVRMEPIGEDIVAPSSSGQRQQALLNAFRNVDQFKTVEEFYSGKKIPEDEFFENTLVRDFQIPRDRVGTFIEVFTENLGYLNLFDARRAVAVEQATGPAVEPEPVKKAPAARTDSRVREFLDTCFVMMPFGDWSDRYYKEIYAPAIKEAGFEPIRADELFSAGTVVEQIWEQIQKAPVLLADLSGKNANVFYELGLSHAARKPVVFTAADLGDIPFDLQHLRVIIYDVHEPKWDDKLGKSVTDFLKNAKTEPVRSIPQPFREAVDTEND